MKKRNWLPSSKLLSLSTFAPSSVVAAIPSPFAMMARLLTYPIHFLFLCPCCFFFGGFRLVLTKVQCFALISDFDSKPCLEHFLRSGFLRSVGTN